MQIARSAPSGDLSSLLRPAAGSPLIGHGSATLPGFVALDPAGTPRPAPPSIGALEPAP